MASNWKTVPARFRCHGGLIEQPNEIPENGVLVLKINTDACAGRQNHVRYLEHVQAFLTIESSRRGDVTVNLTSPMKTNSVLLSRRPQDDDDIRGFRRWPFMTTHTWGEDPRGEWILTVGFKGEFPQQGRVTRWALLLHGTQEAPYIDEIANSDSPKLDMSKKMEYAEGILHDLEDQTSNIESY